MGLINNYSFAPSLWMVWNIPTEDDFLTVSDYDIDETLTQSEKLTINMPLMTIAQIDALIESGHFQNRAEFFRFSAMQQLEKYGNERFPWK